MNKKSIISEIFFGDKGDVETVKHSEKYWRMLNQVCELGKELEKDFSSEQKEIFDKLDFIHAGRELESAVTHFTQGFKLGLLMGIEVMENESE